MQVAGSLLFLLILIAVLVVAAGPGAAIVQRSVLARQIMAIISVANVIAAARRQSAGAGGKLGGDGSVGSDPVGQSILAVLNDGPTSLITIISLSGLAWGDWGVVNELEKVLAVASDNGDFLAVLAEGIELVGVGSLDLLTRNVGQLGLGHKRLGLSTDKLLLQDDNLGRVGLLVLELGNLVGDLLLACLKLVS